MEDEEFEALYGAAPGASAPAPVPASAVPTPAAAPVADAADDGDLFDTLYGGTSTSLSELPAKPRAVPGKLGSGVLRDGIGVVVQVQGRGHHALPAAGMPWQRRLHRCLITVHVPPATLAAVAPSAVPTSAEDELVPDQRPGAAAPTAGQAQTQEEEDSEDELMITLDENATSYDAAASHPSAHKAREARGLGGQLPPAGPTAVSAPRPAPGPLPGLTPEFGGGGGPAPSGFGFGGGRPAIGGVPRSAIPGLGGMAQSMGRGPTAGAGVCTPLLLGLGAGLFLGCTVSSGRLPARPLGSLARPFWTGMDTACEQATALAVTVAGARG